LNGLKMMENYYTSQKDKLMKAFDRSSKNIRLVLDKYYSHEFSENVLRQARKEYETLIPQIPYIGGSQNHMTNDLLESVQSLAVLRVLTAQGKTVVESCEIIYQAMETRLSRYPRLLLRIIGRLQFTRMFIRRLQRQAIESQKRGYPGNFVFNIIIGDGKEFDWGIDFAECGICKFYKVQNAFEFMPYICLIDYALSDGFGYGLVRTETLAEGADRCNPRMKKNGQTERRFPPGFLLT
jgi:hypothetical protein